MALSVSCAQTVARGQTPRDNLTRDAEVMFLQDHLAGTRIIQNLFRLMAEMVGGENETVDEEIVAAEASSLAEGVESEEATHQGGDQ